MKLVVKNGTVDIDKESARRIVELAQSGDATPIGDGTAANPIRLPTAAPPVADDEAAVTAMSRAYASQQPEGFRPALNGIRCVLAAIKAGNVPGICTTAERDKALSDLAAETDAKHRALTCAADYAERAESNNREINRLANIVANDGDRIAALTAQRDRLAGLLLGARDRMGCGCGECLCARCSETWDKITAALAELEKNK